MNPSLFAQHPWASCFATFLAGMIIKWLLDLFFLRGQFDQVRQQLARREREFQDLRVQFGKTQTEFRSKSDLLDAVQKSKAGLDAESKAEQAALSQSIRELESKTEAHQSVISTLEIAVLARDRSLAELTASAASADQQRSAAATALADKDKELAHLRSQLESAHRIRATAESSAGRLEGELANARKQIGELEGDFKELEAELRAATKANESLTEQLRILPTTIIPAPSLGASEAALLADLETVSRDRNELAAELAALKAATPPHPAVRRNSPKKPSGQARSGLTQPTLLPDEALPLREVSAPGSQHLSEVDGIGPEFEKKLSDAGICTFTALARCTIEQLTEICPPSESGKPDYASWIAQAQVRVPGDNF
ncbi:MAG: hypothetical protein EXS36_10075 [Pedosphaera sp.]|nr:hypothetical protein [Pedosphaera sp.]